MKSMFKALVALTVLGAGSAMAASPATTTFNVTANIASNCAINTPAGNVAFGTYDPLSGSGLTANGSVVFRCTKNTAYTVSLSTGAGSYATRTMTNGTDTLAYNLYTTAGLTTVFGDGTGGTGTATGNGSGIANTVGNQKTVSYYGSLAAGQDVSTGNYSDTITISVSY